MIADQNFYDIFLWRSKFVRAEHSATAEGENCAYGLTLQNLYVLKIHYLKSKIKFLENLI